MGVVEQGQREFAKGHGGNGGAEDGDEERRVDTDGAAEDQQDSEAD